MVTWVLYLCIGVLIGAMAGFYFARLDDLPKKQKRTLEDKLKKSEQELQNYRDQVSTHFKETASLVNQMTESYQKVHEHLAGGASLLCNTEIEVNRLEVTPKISPKMGNTQHFSDQHPQQSSSDTPHRAEQNSYREKEPGHKKYQQTDQRWQSTQQQQNKQELPPEASAMADDIEAPKTSDLSNTKNNKNDNNNKESSVSDAEDHSEVSSISAVQDDAVQEDSGRHTEDTSASGNFQSQRAEKSELQTQSDDSLPGINEPDRSSTKHGLADPQAIETMAVAEDLSEDSGSNEVIPAKGSQMVH